VIFSASTASTRKTARRYWVSALDKAGLSDVHFHDLRHTGNDLTAGTGATLREMMDRMGHSSPRAALIYMHGSDVRQRQIADSLSKLARQELTGRRSGTSPARASSGTQRARKPRRPL
jgi:integrase